MKLQMHIHAEGLTNYVEVGKTTFKELRTIMRLVANAGRTRARQLLSSQFRRRTGKLNREARKIQTSVTAKATQVSALVGPMPHLTNIFENGAVIPKRTIEPRNAKAIKFPGTNGEAFVRGKMTAGGGNLPARPVRMPALEKMRQVAEEQITSLLERIGK